MFLNDITHGWIGEIPSRWELKRIKHIFYISKNISDAPDEEDVLSLTFGGIIKRDISANEGQLPESYKGYSKIYPDDIVMNPMDLKSGWIDKSEFEGIISPSYYVLKPYSNSVDIQYFTYQFQRHYRERIFFPFGQGVSYDYRWGLGKETLLNFPIISPPLLEQKQISQFLDRKTQQIDELIEKTERKIELLKEKRTSLINHCVTKGLNPNVEIKDSGVEWIGEIPSHWEVKRLKYMSSVQFSSVDRHISDDEITVNVCHYPDVYYNEKITSNTKLNIGSCSEQEYEKYRLKKGEVIITKDSESPDDIGVPTFVEENLDDTVCGYHLSLISTLESELLGEFLFRYIQSHKVSRYFEVHSNGITRFGLGKYIIENLFVPFSNLSEQQEIIDFLDNKTKEIDILIDNENQRIELLKEYRQSFISEVVTGKIDVRDEVVI